MEFGLSQEQQMVVDTVRSFVENELYPLEDDVERTGQVPRELGREIQDKVRTLGFYAPNIPEKFGGGGLDHLTLTMLERELGRASMALSVFWGRPSNILCACNDDQRERYLLPSVRGEKIDALAMSEPDAGSDLRGIKTFARRDGDDYVITGTKHGFVCPCCGHREHCVLAGRGLYQCNRCKKQTSPTAGTIFHATKLPLTLWFAAIHLIVTAKNGISSVELGRRLGVKQPTAWTVKHKIMAVMARREGETRLTGRVEMDDAYLGGVRSGGKRGRGAAGKTPFVAAVSTSPEGRPGKLKLAPVKGFRKREIARGAKHWLAPGAAVVTDGLGCWGALDEAACSHRAIRTGSGRQAARMASFKWVNTTLGNIKSAITGTYRKLGPDHAGRYLASFAWRYNRRYQLETMIPRFVHSAARTEPMPYRLLIAG